MSYAPIPMIPGPVSLHEKVIAAMSQDYGSGQIDNDFLPLYSATAKNLSKIIKTNNDVVLMTGEAMLVLWGALKSCLAKGDKVLSIGTGVFGDGIGEMAKSIGCEVEQVSLPYSSTITEYDLDLIADKIKAFKPKMITAVHCETPSGTLNPLEKLGQLKQDLGVALFYVDAVASIGGALIETDKWNIDLLLGGSQKCLSAPPSMSIVAVSQNAWDIMASINYQGYDSILPFKNIYEDGRCPYTPYWHGVSALHAASMAILEEGLEKVFERHIMVSEQCRTGLNKLGIKLWTDAKAINSPTVTAALVPSQYDFATWQKKLSSRGLIVAGSFGEMAGKVFRLGHMGTQAQVHLMELALNVIEDELILRA